MKKLVILLLHLGLVSCVFETMQSLNSADIEGIWIVRNSNGSISVPGKVPGGVYTDLQAAGLLDDNLFYRFHDIDYRWVGYEDWTYSLTFDVSPEVFMKGHISLVFQGLDTVGTVYLNNILVGTCNNMFVRYVFPVKDLLNEGSNELRVEFVSPVLAALANHDKQSASYEIPPTCEPTDLGECYVAYVRKMQSSFSWDWGPAFPSSGIWKSAWLEGYDYVIVRDVTVDPVHNPNNASWDVNIKVYADVGNQLFGIIDYELYLNLVGGMVTHTYTYTTVMDPNTETGFDRLIGNLTITLSEEEVELWWPNGYGDQVRSELVVAASAAFQLSAFYLQFGFRTVKLVENQIDPDLEGTTFYLEVNHVPIFAKGSNWIPGHILPELSDDDRIWHYLTSAEQVYTNMIRVWGGGVYESDWFYTAADDLGIMIWQDIMFCSALYPADDEFLSNVKVEVEQQVKRLQSHASVVMWSGNNENGGVLGISVLHANYSKFYDDYGRLYDETIHPIVREYDATRPFVISSPSNGIKQGRYDQDVGSGLYGDVHYYNYGSDGWTHTTFPDTRFASEYGYQSLPSFLTMAEVTTAEDRRIRSQFSLSRNHHGGGYEQMANMMRQHLPLPDDDDTELYYKTYIYYGQISQAMSVKTETETYRTSRNESIRSDTDVRGLTMGALYWQLNDVWQAPTWASIDYDGRWKMLHYFARKFFAPILPSTRYNPDGHLLLYITSDFLETMDVNITFSVYKYNSFQALTQTTKQYSAKPLSSIVYEDYVLQDVLKDAGCADPVENTCFIYIQLTEPNNRWNVDNYYFPSSLTDAVGVTENPNVRIEKCLENGPMAADLTLKSDNVALFTWLETDVGGSFSDNGFHMVDENGVTLRFYTFELYDSFSCANLTSLSISTLLDIK